MALKAGDIVTLTINPTVQLEPYHYLKPGASLTRALGDDIESSVKTMQDDLRELAMKAAAVELDLVTDLTNAVNGGTLSTLIEKEIGHVAQGEAVGTGVPLRKPAPQAQGSIQGPAKKGPVRKGV